MPHRQRISKILCLVFLLLCVHAAANFSKPVSAQEDNPASEGGHPISIIYVIEFKDILCSPCGESLLDFCLSLPFEFLKSHTWGIVVFDRAIQSQLGDQIIVKKVRGFLTGNQLHFPVVIDFSHMFESLRSRASQLLILDSISSVVRRYGFPLKENQKTSIIETILSRL